MTTSPPGNLRFLEQPPKMMGDIYKENFWASMGTDTSDKKKGGIPFGVRKEMVTKEQDQLLRDIFDLIKAQDVVDLKKEIIEETDLAKFVANRMIDHEPSSDIPTMEECTTAIDGAIVLGSEPENSCTFEAFKEAICAPRSPSNPSGSEMARIIELAMAGKAAEDLASANSGEMSLGQKLFEYHKFMNGCLAACREGDVSGTGTDKVTLTKVVAESYTDNIVREVELLIKRHKQYQDRLNSLEPSLRARNQLYAVDDVFDNEMLPGTRWERPLR